ncbi:MAG TPA: AMP-binding protein [Acidimicrobiales bacterium]|nr:AMP-binding protein [Acidimicrobiales bacterium]
MTTSPAGGPPRPSYRPAGSGDAAADPGAGTVLDTTVAGILRRAASVAPDVTALVQGAPDPARRRRWTYAELEAAAGRAATALTARFAPGERVAVWAPSLPESLVLTYAAAMAAVVLVPVNPALRAGELSHILRQSGAAGLFLVPEFRGHDLVATLGSVRADLPALRHVVPLTDDGWEAFCSSAPVAGVTGAPPSGSPSADRTARPDDVAQLIYTSGTTGAPKGALLTHRGMTNAARFGAVRFGMRAGDVYVHTMPLHHVGGQVVSFQICQQGATAVLLESFDPGLVLELIDAERATLTCGVPTMLLAMIEHPDRGRRDLTSLRAVSGGGSVVSTDLIRHIEATLGVRFTVVFGQTEASGFISQTELDDPDEAKAATLGRPLPAVETRVVDPGTDAVVAIGEVGELEVRGPNVMAGYHDLPTETAEALSPDGWLRTGDLVTMDDEGFLRMVGRRKEMIVSGGENLFPVEIENALAAHPAVAQAAVVGVPDRRWGEAAVAFVRLAPGADADGVVLEGFLRQRLAAFKVPRRWVFVDDFPLTASGKIQKFVLRDRLRPGGAAGDDAGGDTD